MDTGTRPDTPFGRANCCSKLFYCWLNGFFHDGYERDLGINDLHKIIHEDESSYLGDMLGEEWRKEVEKKRAKRANLSEKDKKKKKYKKAERPSLLKTLCRVFGKRFMLIGLLALVEECFIRIAQPLSLGLLIRYFSHKEDYADYFGYSLAAVIIVCAAAFVFTHHLYFFGVCRIGMQVRVSCCSLLYRKALRLSQASLQQTAIGQMVNLLSNDVNRFDLSAIFLHYLWVGPVQMAICTAILWYYYGPCCLVGIILLILFVPFQGWMGKQFSRLRRATAGRTDKRVRVMNEIVSGIRMIKMYTWEFPYSSLVAEAREDEIKYVRKTANFRAVNTTFFFTSSKVLVFITLLVYLLLGNHLTPELVFVTLALYNNVRLVMTLFFPSAIAQLAESLVSIRRLEDFLLMEEREALDAPIFTSTTNVNIPEEYGVSLTNVCAKWDHELPEYTLEDISVSVKPGKLVALIGHVGAGKGSVLQTILKELPVISGRVDVKGAVGYAAQEPWLFSGSVKDNIVFGKPFVEEWYDKVVDACALRRDLELLPYGDKTLIGDRGSTLSGGQKARITLARTVYSNADIYLLDDPLSAVDAEVGQQIFQNCIRGLLGSKARILVTHQLQFMKFVDHIIILDDGAIQIEGTYEELKKRGINFNKMKRAFMEERLSLSTPSLSSTTMTPKMGGKYGSSNKLRRESSVSSRRSSGASGINPFLKYGIKDDMSGDHATLLGNKDARDINASALTFSEDEDRPIDTSVMEPPPQEAPGESAESMEQGKVSLALYGKYFRAGANSCFLILLIALSIICQAFYSTADCWLNWWTDAEEIRGRNESIPHEDVNDPLHYVYHDRDVQLYGYTFLVSMVFFTSWLRTLLFFRLCLRSSVRLHKTMFEGIMRSPMQFFETTPNGRILNRFSKDMGQIDDVLPMTFFDAASIFLNVLAIVAVIAFANPYLLIPAGVLFVVFFILLKYYMKTARSVKRLEGITRSPVFSHLSISLYGLSTIRAFGVQQKFIHDFDAKQDLHSSAWFLFLATTRWLGVWLDWISVTYIALVTISFFFISPSGAIVGLGVSSAMMLTGMFQWGIRQAAETENQMVSVERVMDFAAIPPEASLKSSKDKAPPAEWPQYGRIVFSNMYLFYGEHPVLRGINCEIKPGEKIGIVGRTGAGKSSLISALFRISEPTGSVIIDDVDVGKIGLHDLRAKISIIPQEPVLFSVSLRRNLDPFGQYSDEEIWKALDASHLGKDIRQHPEGLELEVAEGGANFSVGQRQLLCLARAILRQNKILVLDEATANVDQETDALIQTTILTRFEQCTVLTIAHRLHTVMHCDRIMVLDAGRISEFNEPYVLLQDANSHLRKLVEQTGKTTADSLVRLAKKAHELRQDSTAT